MRQYWSQKLSETGKSNQLQNYFQTGITIQTSPRFDHGCTAKTSYDKKTIRPSLWIQSEPKPALLAPQQIRFYTDLKRLTGLNAPSASLFGCHCTVLCLASCLWRGRRNRSCYFSVSKLEPHLPSGLLIRTAKGWCCISHCACPLAESICIQQVTCSTHCGIAVRVWRL